MPIYTVLITTVTQISENVSEAALIAVQRRKNIHSSVTSMLEVLKRFIETWIIVTSRVCEVLVGSTQTEFELNKTTLFVL